MRIGVLVSGRGSNLEALLEAGLEVVLVVANRPGARALRIADDHGVRALVLARTAFPDVDARDAAIGQALEAAKVELVVLAGYDHPHFGQWPAVTTTSHGKGRITCVGEGCPVPTGG